MRTARTTRREQVRHGGTARDFPRRRMRRGERSTGQGAGPECSAIGASGLPAVLSVSPENNMGRRAFSLIEVIAAVAIFAIGMIAVLGLFTPVTKSVATVTDAEAAARVADAVRAQLEAMPFAQAAALIQLPADVQKNDANPGYNPADGAENPHVLFGTLAGEVGVYDGKATPPNWHRINHAVSPPRLVALPNRDKYFEIDLIRNEALSPAEDPLPVVIAYTMRVRWPAFVRTSPTAAKQAGQSAAGGSVPFDQSRKQVLFFTGAIRR
jgi:prepilin-type N-terminal cleavage/methylation domain-containing protein